MSTQSTPARVGHDAETPIVQMSASESEGWKLAAMRAGLYRSGTDVSTFEKWQKAQVDAACAMLSKQEQLERENAALVQALEAYQKACDRSMIETDKPDDWELAQTLARAALDLAKGKAEPEKR